MHRRIASAAIGGRGLNEASYSDTTDTQLRASREKHSVDVETALVVYRRERQSLDLPHHGGGA
jgi:hypothetical protein